jgi:signal transduction histidine kinase
MPVLGSDGALIGTLCGIDPAPHRRSESELAALTVLARLVGYHIEVAERARREGVRLAARTAEHEVKNALVPAVYYAGILAHDQELPARLREAAAAAHASARKASDLIDRLVAVEQIDEIDWGTTSTIDLTKRDGK